jgi:Right handed beta helix region
MPSSMPSKTPVPFQCGAVFAVDECTIVLNADIVCTGNALTPATRLTGLNQTLDCDGNTITDLDGGVNTIIAAGGTIIRNCTIVSDATGAAILIDENQVRTRQAAVTSTGLFAIDTVTVTDGPAGGLVTGIRGVFVTVAPQLNITNSVVTEATNGIVIASSVRTLQLTVLRTKSNMNSNRGLAILSPLVRSNIINSEFCRNRVDDVFNDGIIDSSSQVTCLDSSGANPVFCNLICFVCAMTYSQNGITISLTDDIDCTRTAAASAVILTGQNQVLNCNGNTITDQDGGQAVITAGGGTTIRNCTIVTDATDGIRIADAEAATTSTGVFVLDNVSVTGASVDGLLARFTTAVTSRLTITNSDFSTNGGDGIFIPATTTPLTVTLQNVEANNNVNNGIDVNSATTLTMTDVTANTNGVASDLDGIRIDGVTDSTLMNVTSNGSGNNGIGIIGTTASATLTDVTTNMNGQDGIGIGGRPTAVRLTSVISNMNAGDGIFVQPLAGATAVTVMEVIANENGDDGIDFAAPGITAVISNSVFCDNGDFDVENDGTINPNVQNRCTNPGGGTTPIICALACP